MLNANCQMLIANINIDIMNHVSINQMEVFDPLASMFITLSYSALSIHVEINEHFAFCN